MGYPVLLLLSLAARRRDDAARGHSRLRERRSTIVDVWVMAGLANVLRPAQKGTILKNSDLKA
jgi:hypothetical protein